MKKIAIIGLAVILILLAGVAIGCGDDSNNKEIAMQVAKDWTSTEVDYITNNLTMDIWNNTFYQTEIPVTEDILRPIIKEQVLNNLTWTYTEENKLTNVYVIEARTTVNYEVPQIGSGSVDVGYVLYCSWGGYGVTSIGQRYYSYEYASSPEYLSS